MHSFGFFELHNLAYKSDFLDDLIFFTAEYLPYFLIVSALLFLFVHQDFTHKQKNFFNFRNLLKIDKVKIKEGVLIFGSSLLAWFSFALLKLFFNVQRPFVSLVDIVPMFTAGGAAFPSGHVTFFTALGFAIFLNHKRVGALFMLAAFFVGVARVIAGVHYPLDIIAGFSLGVLMAYVTILLYNLINSYGKNKSSNFS